MQMSWVQSAIFYKKYKPLESGRFKTHYVAMVTKFKVDKAEHI